MRVERRVLCACLSLIARRNLLSSTIMAKGKKSGEAKAVTSGKRAKKVLRDNVRVATRRLREAPPPEVQAYLDAAAQRLAPPPPGYATETITHVLFECPALSTLRQNIPGLPPPPSLAPTQETLITILHPRYLAIRKSVYRFFAAAQGVLRPDLQSQASQLSTVP
jgi:hypothetical protein